MYGTGVLGGASYGTQGAVVASSGFVLGSSFAYYATDITLNADDSGDTIRIRIAKNLSVGNTITVDNITIIPKTLDNGLGPQDLARRALVNPGIVRQLVKRSE